MSSVNNELLVNREVLLKALQNAPSKQVYDTTYKLYLDNEKQIIANSNGGRNSYNGIQNNNQNYYGNNQQQNYYNNNQQQNYYGNAQQQQQNYYGNANNNGYYQQPNQFAQQQQNYYGNNQQQNYYGNPQQGFNQQNFNQNNFGSQSVSGRMQQNAFNRENGFNGNQNFNSVNNFGQQPQAYGFNQNNQHSSFQQPQSTYDPGVLEAMRMWGIDPNDPRLKTTGPRMNRGFQQPNTQTQQVNQSWNQVNQNNQPWAQPTQNVQAQPVVKEDPAKFKPKFEKGHEVPHLCDVHHTEEIVLNENGNMEREITHTPSKSNKYSIDTENNKEELVLEKMDKYDLFLKEEDMEWFGRSMEAFDMDLNDIVYNQEALEAVDKLLVPQFNALIASLPSPMNTQYIESCSDVGDYYKLYNKHKNPYLREAIEDWKIKVENVLKNYGISWHMQTYQITNTSNILYMTKNDTVRKHLLENDKMIITKECFPVLFNYIEGLFHSAPLKLRVLDNRLGFSEYLITEVYDEDKFMIHKLGTQTALESLVKDTAVGIVDEEIRSELLNAIPDDFYKDIKTYINDKLKELVKVKEKDIRESIKRNSDIRHVKGSQSNVFGFTNHKQPQKQNHTLDINIDSFMPSKKVDNGNQPVKPEDQPTCIEYSFDQEKGFSEKGYGEWADHGKKKKS